MSPDTILRPVPKPKPRKKVRGGKRGAPTGRPRTRLKTRTRMKPVNRKRGGSAFPKQRDREYRRWVWTENPCMLRGRVIAYSICSHDVSQGLAWRGFKHMCWGANTPAHVGKHQAKGAPDFGVLVPLCQAAHQFYDEHRYSWYGVTGWTADAMAGAAEDYGREYLERGGWVDRGGAPRNE